jgi:DNA-binding LacI/PurR family transcriptional regulator
MLILSQQKSSEKTIGIIVPDMVTYFFSAVISGIENFAKEKGYFVVITNSHDRSDQEEKCVNHLLEIGACGVISSHSGVQRWYSSTTSPFCMWIT